MHGFRHAGRGNGHNHEEPTVYTTLRWRETDSNHRSLIEGSSGSPQSRQPFPDRHMRRGFAVRRVGPKRDCMLHVSSSTLSQPLSRNSDEAGRTRRRSRQQGKFEDRGSRLIPGPKQSGVFVKRRFALHTRYRVGERDQESSLPLKTGPLSFQGALTGFMIVGGCGAVVVLGSDRSNTAPFVEPEPRNVPTSAPAISAWPRGTPWIRIRRR